MAGLFESEVNRAHLALYEVFDNPYPIRWNYDRTYGEFEIAPGVNYSIELQEEDIASAIDGPRIYKDAFYGFFESLGVNIDPAKMDWWDLGVQLGWRGVTVWQAAFSQDGNYRITGTAGSKSVRVFATVFTALTGFLREHRPGIIYFSALEPSRRKLYRAMIRRLGAGVYKPFEKNGVFILVRSASVRDIAKAALEVQGE